MTPSSSSHILHYFRSLIILSLAIAPISILAQNSEAPLLLKTITPFQTGIKTVSITDYTKLNLYKSESELFSWEAKIEISKSEIKAYGYLINSSDKALPLVLDGFGLHLSIKPQLTYIGPALPPAPAVPYWIEVPAKTRLELTHSISLKDYKFKKAQSIEVSILLMDAFDKVIGTSKIAGQLPD